MSNLKTRLQEQARQASTVSNVDLREESSGGSSVVWPAGVYRGRIAEVIEYGVQKQRPFQGTAKAPAEEVQLRVMLFPTQKVKKDLGEDVKPLFIRLWPMTIYNAARSKSKQTFDKMNIDGTAKHFREFIGEAFRFKLEVKTKDGRSFNSVDLLSTLPAINEETGEPLPVPEVPDDRLILFTFNKPLKEMWDRLHIDGKREDGTSKNFIQEKIIGALNFPGSDVEAMLKGAGESLAEVVEAPATPAPAKKAAPKKAAPVVEDELPEPPTDDEDY